jgi:hypothetical protein
MSKLILYESLYESDDSLYSIKKDGKVFKMNIGNGETREYSTAKQAKRWSDYYKTHLKTAYDQSEEGQKRVAKHLDIASGHADEEEDDDYYKNYGDKDTRKIKAQLGVMKPGEMLRDPRDGTILVKHYVDHDIPSIRVKDIKNAKTLSKIAREQKIDRKDIDHLITELRKQGGSSSYQDKLTQSIYRHQSKGKLFPGVAGGFGTIVDDPDQRGNTKWKYLGDNEKEAKDELDKRTRSSKSPKKSADQLKKLKFDSPDLNPDDLKSMKWEDQLKLARQAKKDGILDRDHRSGRLESDSPYDHPDTIEALERIFSISREGGSAGPADADELDPDSDYEDR